MPVIDDGKFVGAVFLDLATAFDYEILLQINIMVSGEAFLSGC